MESKKVSKRSNILLLAIFITLLSTVITTSTHYKANATGTIYINADGSVSGTDKILRNGNIYTFTDDIHGSIIVERDGVVIDGVGKTLQGEGSGIGIDLNEREHVHIRNLVITAFSYGLSVSYNENLLSFSEYEDETFGENWIYGNNITGNHGCFDFSYNINLFNPSGNNYVVFGGNRIFYNNLEDNHVVINSDANINLLNFNGLGNTIVFGHNLIFNNNLKDNADISSATLNINVQNGLGSVISGVDFWDNGYPSGGNYWDSYSGIDQYSGLNQNENESDGIGDTSFIINPKNSDKYPLMGTFYRFDTPYNHQIGIISNSLITDFDYDIVQPYHANLSFNITGESASQGFCRISLPRTLMDGSYSVMFDGYIITYPQVRELQSSDETYRNLYIHYTHSEHIIEIMGTTIIPELPTLIILPLFMLTTLLATLAYRRKTVKSTSL